MAVSKNMLKGWFNIFDLRFGSIARSFTLIVVSNLIKNEYNKINQENKTITNENKKEFWLFGYGFDDIF